MSEPTSYAGNGPAEPTLRTFEDRATELLEIASRSIEALTRSNELLRVKCDTVDALCGLANSGRGGYAGIGVNGSHNDICWRIERLLAERLGELQQVRVMPVMPVQPPYQTGTDANGSPVG